MIAEVVYTSPDPQLTYAAGRELGQLLRGRDVVALHGPLGAGKTQFTKGLAAGLGVPPDEPVVSPTFVLVREYAGRLRLYHLDAYRLSGAQELRALGFDEMLAEADAVIAVEWAERVADAVPAGAVHVEFAHVGEMERRLRATWSDRERLARFGALLEPPA